MAKVLKGRYFPSSSFLEAKNVPNMSFTWRSILSARDVIMKGARKTIGNGATINIWKDPRVPSLPEFRVFSVQSERNAAVNSVKDLWVGNHWNQDLLNSCFSAWEFKEICNIPIPFYEGEDCWTWHYSKDGRFTIKSAYNMLVTTQKSDVVSSSNDKESFD